MTWTRMADKSYFAVGRTYGVTTGYRVRRSFDRSPNPAPWVLEINDVDSDSKRTCREAKDAAAMHHARECRSSLAANKVN